MNSALDQLKALSAPALMAVIIGMGLFIWNGLQARTASLEAEDSGYRTSPATIPENQRNSAESRVDFQDSTTSRLNRMEDVLVSLSNNISALTAIQAERSAR